MRNTHSLSTSASYPTEHMHVALSISQLEVVWLEKPFADFRCEVKATESAYLKTASIHMTRAFVLF